MTDNKNSTDTSPDASRKARPGLKRASLVALKSALLYGTAWLVAWPMTSTVLFPRAEDVVAEQGLNPKIVSELAPNKHVYVRTDDALGKTHALLDLGPLGAPLLWYQTIREGSELGHANSGYGTLEPFGLCEIYVHKSAFKDRPKEAFQKVLLHEIRHCSTANRKLLKWGFNDSVAAEGDADAQAVAVLAREMRNPGLKEKFLGARAVSESQDAEHDNVLYVDAVLNHRKAPSAKAIDAANKQAARTYGPLKQRHIAIETDKAMAAAGVQGIGPDVEWRKKVEAYDIGKEKLSPLARHRAELFAQGLDTNLKVIVTLRVQKGPA